MSQGSGRFQVSQANVVSQNQLEYKYLLHRFKGGIEPAKLWKVFLRHDTSA